MENNNVKNYGCLTVIIGLIIIYYALNIFFYLTDSLAGILGNPIINYGIPVVFIIVLIFKDSFKKK